MKQLSRLYIIGSMLLAGTGLAPAIAPAIAVAQDANITNYSRPNVTTAVEAAVLQLQSAVAANPDPTPKQLRRRLRQMQRLLAAQGQLSPQSAAWLNRQVRTDTAALKAARNRKVAADTQAKAAADRNKLVKERLEIRRKRLEEQARLQAEAEQAELLRQQKRAERRKKREQQARLQAEEEAELLRQQKRAERRKKREQQARLQAEEDAELLRLQKRAERRERRKELERLRAEEEAELLRKQKRAERRKKREELARLEAEEEAELLRQQKRAERRKKKQQDALLAQEQFQKRRQAERFLDNWFPPEEAKTPRLFKRVNLARGILADETLPKPLFRQVRKRLRIDRKELRRRVALEQGTPSVEKPLRSSRAAVRRYLRDNRPPEHLKRPQLVERIRLGRALLDRVDVSPGIKPEIKERLAEDRHVLRRRLKADKRKRRAKLAERRRNNDLDIAIGLGAGVVAGLAANALIQGNQDIAAAEVDQRQLEQQLVARPNREIRRRYSLNELRARPELRQLVPGIEVDTIRFGSGEAFIREEEVDQLERIGDIIERVVAQDPNEVFLIEGHTDAVGSDRFNLRLSEQRADAVREALLEFFVIKPENIEVIGYGERFLKIPTLESEEENRRVSVRRVSEVLVRR